MEQYTIEYLRWRSAFKAISSNENTISQINTISKATYDLNSIPEEVALSQYNKNSVYFLTFFEKKNPKGFLEYNNGYFKIGFIDDHLREFLYYSFKSVDHDKLFLDKTQFWEFENGSDQKKYSEVFRFSESGKVTINKVDIPTRQGIQMKSIKPIDVSGFYEDFPEFGKYESLIRKDRMDSLNLNDDHFQKIS